MTDPASRLTAALSGSYGIERELGTGGMATVYLAADLKHGRKVAIKVLKPALAAVIGGERFLAEIKTTAALQHPHILPLFDSGEADGFLYYVMPFVEGESLREKLDREKQLSVDESARIARAVASALHYAHERGIVHRDIKPANILIHAGEPVVADFGIALAISAAGDGRLTETGLSIGTPYYMSPEQATADRDPGPRSDIYSLACMLFEMLVGDPPHTGSNAQAVLAKILTERARPITELRETVPPHMGAAIARALERLPADRFENAEEFGRALSDEGFSYLPTTASHGGVPGSGAPGRQKSWGADAKTRILIGGNLILVAVVGWLAIQWPGSSALDADPPAHLYTITDTLRDSRQHAVSRNGDVVYVATTRSRRRHLRIRRAAESLPVEIPNTAGASNPVFSPSGDWVAFTVGLRELRKVQVATGTSITLVPEGQFDRVVHPYWANDGSILFASDEGIHRVSDGGGRPELIWESDGAAFFPTLLPNGRTVLFTEASGSSDPHIVGLDLETGDTAVVASPAARPVWSPTGHVLFGHPSGAIFAVPFDLKEGEVTGPPVPVLEGVFFRSVFAAFDLSETGSLSYVSGTGRDQGMIEFNWVDMNGNVSSIPIQPIDHADARLSPEGQRLAYTRDDQIYVFDFDRGTNRRLTTEGREYHNPVWSPDGLRLAFSGFREEGRDARDIYVTDVDSASAVETVVAREGMQYPEEWLKDGSLLFNVRSIPGKTGEDLFTMDMESRSERTALLQADWDERTPRVSPDESLIAYISDRDGEPHVFIREFPEMTGEARVSASRVIGRLVWSREGDAIFYVDGESGLFVRAQIRRSPTLQVADRSNLTDQPIGTDLFGMHPDGQRLLITSRTGAPGEDAPRERLVVVANWLTELKKRLGEGNR